MIELLLKLIVGHTHKWDIIDTYRRQSSYPYRGAGSVVKLMRCEHCGKLKVFEIG